MRVVKKHEDGNGGLVRAIPLAVAATILSLVVGPLLTLVLVQWTWIKASDQERSKTVTEAVDLMRKYCDEKMEVHNLQYRHDSKE